MEYFRNMNPDETQIILWAVLILPWVLFFTLVDWKKINTLHSIGLLTALLAMIGGYNRQQSAPMDLSGRAIAGVLQFFPVNLSLLPVESMLIVQFMPQKLLKKMALILCVGLFNMTVEYLFEGNTSAIFYPHWKPIFSLPFYLFLFSLGYIYHNWLVKRQSVTSAS